MELSGSTLSPEDVTEESYTLQPNDLHELKLVSLTQIGEIIARYHNVDVPKEDPLLFIQHLTSRRDAWFVETPVGLLYLTNIVLDRDADFNVVFWDQRLTMDRAAAAKSVLATAFERFRLPRISSYVPYTNAPLRRFLREIGFVLEGTIRRGWSVEPPVDTILFGMLTDEAPSLTLIMETEDGERL